MLTLSHIYTTQTCEHTHTHTPAHTHVRTLNSHFFHQLPSLTYLYAIMLGPLIATQKCGSKSRYCTQFKKKKKICAKLALGAFWAHSLFFRGRKSMPNWVPQKWYFSRIKKSESPTQDPRWHKNLENTLLTPTIYMFELSITHSKGSFFYSTSLCLVVRPVYEPDFPVPLLHGE